MGNSLRCCLACMLPCGALDLIRIVHLDGYVEEITRPVTAGEILEANPNYVLSKPCFEGVDVPRIMILAPESELRRGSVYFLVPASGAAGLKQPVKARSTAKSTKYAISSNSDCNRKLSGITKEKKPSRRERRSGRVSVWRPHLQSISEDV